ncbi:MAG: DUF1015 domain-containing protein [Balneolaceae bacterium]|nr:MAG: DUF1015 domain-containing protein [Balneolaceae bacterium]
MIHIHPFKAWRPEPNKVKQIACVPYDVIDTDEAREMASGNPDSFLHVIRPEIDLPEGFDLYADETYRKGADNLDAFKERGLLVQEEVPSLYIYQLKWHNRTQTGLFACVSVEDYDNGLIVKHELTRPDKEDDRTRHILTQQAHAEPVMLTFRDSGSIGGLMDTITATEPLYSFTAGDGVEHLVWRVEDTSVFVRAFGEVGKLYVADGHHRCKSASRAVEAMKKENPGHTGSEEYNFFPAVIFPMDQMHIMPYNRVIYKAADSTVLRMCRELKAVSDAPPRPTRAGHVSVYYENTWHDIKLPEPRERTPATSLDVSRLQTGILEPYFSITNPRTDKNIAFVGGIRGTDALKKAVDTGRVSLAFSMHPTSIEELVEVSDAGMLMPPKSTWFEPKLRSGILIHTF